MSLRLLGLLDGVAYLLISLRELDIAPSLLEEVSLVESSV